MHVKREAVFRLVALRDGMRELARVELRGIEHEFTRIPHEGSILEQQLQLLPAEVRAVFQKFPALRRHVGGERLLCVVSR